MHERFHGCRKIVGMIIPFFRFCFFFFFEERRKRETEKRVDMSGRQGERGRWVFLEEQIDVGAHAGYLCSDYRFHRGKRVVRVIPETRG